MNSFLWQFYSLNVFIGEAGRLLVCNREPNLDKFVKNTSLHESASMKWLLKFTNAETDLIYKNKYK